MTLVSPFHACAPQSKIIMTTRKVQLLKTLGCDLLNYMQTLSHVDVVSLFAQRVLDAMNFDSHPLLRPRGEGIVKKCDGLHLALRVLGRLLRTKTKEEEEWKELLNSDIWRLGKWDVIIPALRLSYHNLSARLKELLAYFSLFPRTICLTKTIWFYFGWRKVSLTNHLQTSQWNI
ncbi:putative P-loop containing nucleoside triphosphate hydrolase [Helianthus debilis subsp. tardiflorus]